MQYTTLHDAYAARACSALHMLGDTRPTPPRLTDPLLHPRPGGKKTGTMPAMYYLSHLALSWRGDLNPTPLSPPPTHSPTIDTMSIAIDIDKTVVEECGRVRVNWTGLYNWEV